MPIEVMIKGEAKTSARTSNQISRQICHAPVPTDHDMPTQIWIYRKENYSVRERLAMQVSVIHCKFNYICITVMLYKCMA